MTFDKNISGKVYVGTGGDVYIYTLRADGRFAGTSAGTDLTSYGEYVTLTGWKLSSQKGTVMYQTTTGEYIDVTEGWKQYSQSAAYSQKQAQRLVDQIIKNNKTIIANNLLCARYAEKLTPEQRNQVRALQQRLEERNDALIDAGVCTDLSKSYPAGYTELQSYLTRLMQGEGVGSVTVAIIVTAVVIASLSTAAYFAYKAYAAQSEQDVKYSKELTKILADKLTPEEYQQLLNETKGIVTKARIRQSLSSSATITTLALCAVGGYFIYKTLIQQ